ncbi:MAG: PLP-dependent transferase [Planctomycetaceae bacterium]
MPVDLLKSPRFKAEHLGLPMPDSIHAVSACLPLWRHNVAYEEGDQSVIGQLKSAYPRFCLNPMVRELFRQTFEPLGKAGFIFPSRHSALEAAGYVANRGGGQCRVVPIPGQDVVGVAASGGDEKLLKQYWQHTGEIISSRMAVQITQGTRITFGTSPSADIVRQRVADFEGTSAENVRLYPSGMSAMMSAWRTVQKVYTGAPSVQFGFPYVDTLKIQQRFHPSRCEFFPVGSSGDIDQLETVLRRSPVSAVFCETPANPLLTCPDLHRLRNLADQFGFLIVIDDTLAACLNLDVLHLSDIVVTSLTKYFSGYGDLLAGSLTLNPNGARAEELQQALDEHYECLIADVDIDALEANSRDVADRVNAINQNATELARRLSEHPRVKFVWHPSLHHSLMNDSDDCSAPASNYEQLRRPDGGFGGLMSILLHDAETAAPAVFDALSVCKGPNLGTVFTLACPYTILAHYDELPFVESCGVSRWLIRLSVGIEPIEELWSRFEQALSVQSL